MNVLKLTCDLGTGFPTVDVEREKELQNCCVPQLATCFQRHSDHVHDGLGEWTAQVHAVSVICTAVYCGES